MLTWRQLPVGAIAISGSPAHLTTSFEAVGDDGSLYSINILDGTVLLDGLPPSCLPNEVLEHPLYKRTFGSVNFEVVRMASGTLQTIKPVGGRYYDFCLSSSSSSGSGGGGGSSGVLGITELDGTLRLQLLDVGADGGGGAWGSELPVRLREMHSHWLCR